MNVSTVQKRSYPAPKPCETEILRYAGCVSKNVDGAVLDLMRDCAREMEGKLSFQVCYRRFPIVYDGQVAFLQADSTHLRHYLGDCEEVILFAATVGLEADRLITRYGRISPSRGLMMQAIGAERIEALCDVFCRDLKQELSQEDLLPKSRFSPGYGDYALENQRAIFAALDCPRQIGLSLNESLLMTPSKSVTALVGLQSKKANQ